MYKQKYLLLFLTAVFLFFSSILKAEEQHIDNIPINITSENIPVTDLTIHTPEKPRFKGSSIIIDFTIFPVDTTDKEVVWSTKSHGNGKIVTSKGKGSVVIKNINSSDVLTIKTAQSHIKTYKITMVKNVKTINFSQKKYSLDEKIVSTIAVNHYPAIKDAFTSIKYSINNNNVILLDDSTGQVMAVKNGTTILSVKAVKLDGSILTSSCEIDVAGNIDLNKAESFEGTYDIIFFGTNSNGRKLTQAVISNNCYLYRDLWGSSSLCPEGLGGYLIPLNDYAGMAVIEVDNGTLSIYTKVAFLGSKTIQSKAPNDQYQFFSYDKKSLEELKDINNKGSIKYRNLSSYGTINNAVFYIDMENDFTGRLGKDIIFYSKIEKNIGVIGPIYPDTRLVLRKISSKPICLDQNSLNAAPFNKLKGKIKLQ